MSVPTLIADLAQVGAALVLAGNGDLELDAPEGVALPEDLRASLRARRAELVHWLRHRLAPRPGVICPWCDGGDWLVWAGLDLACELCDRFAWRWSGGALRRCDSDDDALAWQVFEPAAENRSPHAAADAIARPSTIRRPSPPTTRQRAFWEAGGVFRQCKERVHSEATSPGVCSPEARLSLPFPRKESSDGKHIP